MAGVNISDDDLHFTATTTLTKGGQVTATYGPRREHFIRTEADYSEAVLGLWEIFSPATTRNMSLQSLTVSYTEPTVPVAIMTSSTGSG